LFKFLLFNYVIQNRLYKMYIRAFFFHQLLHLIYVAYLKNIYCIIKKLEALLVRSFYG